MLIKSRKEDLKLFSPYRIPLITVKPPLKLTRERIRVKLAHLEAVLALILTFCQ